MGEKAPTTQRISDAAVTEATGKNWKQWFSQLDLDGCKKMTHKDIVALLAKKYTLPPWWSQMVCVTYEQARGLRAAHERPDGFEISVSKTIALPRAMVFVAWHDEKLRRLWLKNIIVIRKATPEKSLRITWSDGLSSLSVDLYERTEQKTQVVVQHQKLADAQTAEAMKIFWKQALATLEKIIKN